MTPKENEITETTEEIKIREKHEQEIKEFVHTFSNKKGKEKNVELTKWVFTGMFMGASDAVPGYSGGTTLALIGFFKKLIIISRCVFFPKYGITRLRALLFMLPFAIGWIGGVFGIAKITELLAKHGMGLELIFFFSFFVIFAIPIYLRSIRKSKTSPVKPLKPYVKWSLIAIGFLIVVGLSLTVLLESGGAPFHGVDSKQGSKFDLHNWWKLAFVAYIAGVVTLIPGGSGAIIQLLSRMYDQIHWTIMAHANENIWALMIFAFFTFLGMVTMVFIMAWFLSRHERLLEFFSLGMLLASPIAIMIIPETNLWGHIKEWEHIIGVISFAILGISFASIINLKTRKKYKTF